MSILVVGKGGTGKSTFINSVFGGEQVAKTGMGVASSQMQGGNFLQPHKLAIGGVDVTLYDSIGLGNPELTDAKIISEMAKHVTTGFDLILVCIRLDDRLDKNTADGIKCLSKSIGENFWRRCIFLFTRTNSFIRDLTDEKSSMTDEHILQKIEVEIAKATVLLENCVKPPNNVDDPFLSICVGRIRHRETLATDIQLPTSQNWLNDFFFYCLARCSETCKDSMYNIASNRLKMTGAVIDSYLKAVPSVIRLVGRNREGRQNELTSIKEHIDSHIESTRNELKTTNINFNPDI